MVKGFSVRLRSQVVLVAVAGLIVSTLMAQPGAAVPEDDQPIANTFAPRDTSDCRLVEGLETVPPDLVAELFATGYAEVRQLLAKCQEGSIPPSPPIKLKKPKVPRALVPTAFWAYIRYTHTDVSYRSIPLDDPEICSKFVNGSSITTSSAEPGFVVIGGAIGEIPVTSTVNDLQRTYPTGCERTSESMDGIYPGLMSVTFLDPGRLELGSSIGCNGYFPVPKSVAACRSLSLAQTVPNIIRLPKSIQSEIRNPRKGIIKIPLSGGAGGDAYSKDPGTCSSWGDGDPAYACVWVSAWSAQLTLVRAEPLDVPVF